jgi:hypothetical protein
MRRRSLPPAWIKWRRYRYQGLVADGVANGLAWDIAAGEAKSRYRVARILGAEAARNAKLIWVSNGGRPRFVLTGDVAGLTEDQAAAAENLDRQSEPAA